MKKILKWAPVVISLLLAAGVKLVFHACEPMEDGSWMHCHSAENAVLLAAIVMAVLSLLIPLRRNSLQAGCVSCLVAAGGIVTALIPGKIVSMCMMESMHCHAVMKPAVILFSALITVCAAAAAVVCFTEQRKS